MENAPSREVAVVASPNLGLVVSPQAASVLIAAGGPAMFAAEEFFKAMLSNPHTRRAYGRVVGKFLDWCSERNVELQAVSPGLAGEFIDGVPGSTPTKNQALAAMRHFFDAMVQRHAVALNPFASVRGTKYSVTEGKTPELGLEQARALLKSIKVSTVVGLRDRAVLGILAYTGARVGAVAKLRIGDYRNLGAQKALRFREKNGKDREIPVRHDLEGFLAEYIAAAKLEDEAKQAPLFRGADGKRPALTREPFKDQGIRLMMKRRLDDAGLPELFSPHSFRVAVVTDLLTQNVPLEDVQYLAGHASPTTTRVYDRRRRRVSRNIVERISI